MIILSCSSMEAMMIVMLNYWKVIYRALNNLKWDFHRSCFESHRWIQGPFYPIDLPWFVCFCAVWILKSCIIHSLRVGWSNGRLRNCLSKDWAGTLALVIVAIANNISCWSFSCSIKPTNISTDHLFTVLWFGWNDSTCLKSNLLEESSGTN